MNFNNGWYVLYVKPRWEKKVNESLKDILLESFLPQIKTIRQWSDRKKTILKPMFPSYVFVNVKSSTEFHKALSVNGACAYISFGREYAKVSASEIDKIKTLVSADAVTNFEIDTRRLKIGAIKTINQGPLSGLECEVLKVNNKNKVVVRIDSLQQNILATVPSHFI
ncbi:UpxY family transcription antiterminator [Tenacibaculum tangerinum]|uniref:UpxY family transcription antiterminator n=1 Tax=Tenacibaculum tangerinum TaxID=3038772 RepID=A0ABY8KYX0_9FLAO|nr:UpxY family transcription antiterminator [Tenacibaculum tangerinum]WGH74196.1 UpxY family transcription antiterminator [Tenacibaculum tangerinum]